MRASDVGGEESYRKRETECESIQQRTGEINQMEYPWRQTAACTSNPCSEGYTEGEVICHVNPDIGGEGSEKTTKTEDEG